MLLPVTPRRTTPLDCSTSAAMLRALTAALEALIENGLGRFPNQTAGSLTVLKFPANQGKRLKDFFETKVWLGVRFLDRPLAQCVRVHTRRRVLWSHRNPSSFKCPVATVTAQPRALLG